MPYWGMGWALGPNYNVPAVPFDTEQKALEAVKQTQARDANSPQAERDYIDALATPLSLRSLRIAAAAGQRCRGIVGEDGIRQRVA